MTDAPSSWLKPLLAPMRPAARELLVVSLAINLVALTVPIFIQQVYDRVVFHAGMSTLQGLVIGVAVLLGFDFALRTARSRLMQRVALHIDVELGERLFDKLMALPLRRLETRPLASWQNLFRDVDLIRNTLSGASAVLIADLPFVIIFLGAIFVIAPPLAWVFVALLPAFLALAWRSGAQLAAAGETERALLSGRDGLMAEMLAGRGTIKALDLEHAIRPLWEERQAATIEQSIRRGMRADGYMTAGLMLTMLSTVALTAVGALLIIDQQLTVGALVAANVLAGRLFGPLGQLVGTWRSYAAFRQSVRRLGEALALEEDRRDSGITRERPSGVIACEAVNFHYDPKLKPAVDAVTLTFPAHSLTAVVGPNGCGKTTLLKLMLGLYRPEGGRVLLDGADIAQFTRRELAGWIGYLPQECVLFDGTIRDNVAAGSPGASEEAVLRAARMAGVHGAVVDLPDGYATRIGEAGGRLSTGQRQRIALARALVGDPPVLLLDEPSSSLDRQAEEELKATLTALAAERTVIMVTHSPVLLSAAGGVVVLDGGKLAAAGPAATILPRLFAARAPAGARP